MDNKFKKKETPISKPKLDKSGKTIRKTRKEIKEKPRFEERSHYDDRPRFEVRPKYNDRPRFDEKPRYNERPRSDERPKVESKPQIENRLKPRDEMLLSKVYGINACRVFYKQKFPKIIRAFMTEKMAPRFSDLMKDMAKAKRVYRIVAEEELEKISQSTHHEGVCFNIEVDPPIQIRDWFEKNQKTKLSYLLALENIGNPHNLGAIMRVAAHFGVSGIVTTNPKALESGAAKRTAEGGSDFIELIQCESMEEVIKLSKKEGYSIITTSSHKGKSLYKTEFPNKCVLFFGEERFGLTKDVLKSCDISIQIPGTQNVESLNVSSSIAVILGELWKQKKD